MRNGGPATSRLSAWVARMTSGSSTGSIAGARGSMGSRSAAPFTRGSVSEDGRKLPSRCPRRDLAGRRACVSAKRDETSPKRAARSRTRGPMKPKPAHEVELFRGMWTTDPGMKRVFRIVERVARSDATVLVRGETGSGKELVARAIHDLSPRGKGPFRAINCAAVPSTLLESELFGHVRGAFTGAVRDTPGQFRLANKGTLFLDEVAELPLEVQAKMLRVLETRTVTPVGARDPVPVDVRIVAATHRPLRREVEAGRFRADLMYRLRVIPVFLPALRDRVGDAVLLTERILEEYNARGGRRVTRISPGAKTAIERYPWPGNVRELRNALEYAYVIGDGPTLERADLPPEIADPERTIDGAPIPERTNLASANSDAGAVQRALERTGGDRTRAARLLGISRVTLWRRMRELGLLGDRPRA
ncbi:MAG: sigma 54-interacting transcriptional regulator [Deltaproteobacteria bacterium]|nr:sigma 54-interacting transcriptional regulator [Deltaproteobacteria bacterium]